MHYKPFEMIKPIRIQQNNAKYLIFTLLRNFVQIV